MERVIIGKIVNTHGIKGELKVKTSSDFIEERFKKGNHVLIDDCGNMIDMVVKTMRIHKGHVLVSFDNYQDINLVEKYKGCTMYALKDTSLLEDGEYYVGDLIDCDVYDQDCFIGKVTDVQLYEHHDVLVVEGKQKILIPYVDAFVIDEDIENKCIHVHLIEGFYDED